LAESFDDRKTRPSGKIDVEKNKVGSEAPENVDRFVAGGGFSNQLDPGFVDEQATQFLQTKRFIVDDDDPDSTGGCGIRLGALGHGMAFSGSV
jgi:hypothetical protein